MSFTKEPSTPETVSSTDDEYEEKKRSTSYSLDRERWTDETFDDHASNLSDDDAASSVASLTPSILEYRTLHGRTYHSDCFPNVRYWAPNDRRQMEAADAVHHLTTLVRGGTLYSAPLGNDIKHVLDVGTGTGTWAITFADRHPHTTVTGTDISPIQSTWVPTNLAFHIEDATQPAWSYPSSHFGFVHMRYLAGSVPSWTALLREAHRCCAPGGWAESLEVSCAFRSDDGSVREGTPMEQWGRLFGEAGGRLGRRFDVVGEGLVEKAFEAAGFVDVERWEFKCPVGGWPADARLKEIGLHALVALEMDLEGWILFALVEVLGWSKEQLDAFISHLQQQLHDTSVHGYLLMSCVYGRKPKADEAPSLCNRVGRLFKCA